MKLSSQTIILCVALVAAATTAVNASSRNLIRNRKATTRQRRNLIKVESATTLEDIVQIDNTELVRALLETNSDMMSMSMPSMPGGGDSEDGDSEDGGSGSGSTDSSEDDGTPPAETPSTDTTPDASPTDGEKPTEGGGDDGTTPAPSETDMTPEASPTAVGEPTGSGLPAGSPPLDAPTSGETDGTVATTSSASRQNAAIAATITIAFMVVPFIL
jgi:hypothetical protein